MNLCFFFLCLRILTLSTPSEYGSSPYFVTNFKADMLLNNDVFNFTSEFIFNTKRSEYGYLGKFKSFGETVYFGIYQMNETTKEVTGGQCRDADFMRLDYMFEWVIYARYSGKQTIAEQECSMYYLDIPKVNDTLYLCIGEENSFPVYYGVEIDGSILVQYFFYNQVEGDYPVTFPGLCNLPLNCCVPEDPVIQTKEFVRFHNTGDYSLANEDTADAMGDVYYICMVKVSNDSSNRKIDPHKKPLTIGYDVVSIFEVSVNTTWGQYSLCNGGYCSGGMEGTVGREVAMGVGEPWGGQCTSNKETGSWYSFRDVDECQGSQVVGDDGCAWKTVGVKKTIEYSCLQNHGFEDACIADAHAPFTKSYQIFKNAFDSDVYSEGGCPDVKP